MNKIDLFIFDMDGLMFDTGRMAYQAYLKSAEKYDYELTHNVYYHLTGRTEADIREGMAELYGEEVPYMEWRAAMNQFKQEGLAKAKRVYKKKGLVEILDFAKQQGIKIAVASSNYLEMVNHYLAIEDVESYIDIIVTGDEVTSGKPSPEIFLTACDKAGVTPEHALVFEDSAAGIEAAGRAGILSVLIEDDITDLPIRTGKYLLKKDVSRVRERPAPANFQFQDLLQAKKYLELKALYL